MACPILRESDGIVPGSVTIQAGKTTVKAHLARISQIDREELREFGRDEAECGGADGKFGAEGRTDAADQVPAGYNECVGGGSPGEGVRRCGGGP
jgi:hypothetical protein